MNIALLLRKVKPREEAIKILEFCIDILDANLDIDYCLNKREYFVLYYIFYIME